VFFALAMFTTLLVHTHVGGTFLVASTGISWAMTLWAPYAIIGAEIAVKHEREHIVGTAELEPTEENQVGLIMSLHNTAISAPQIAAALACSGVFWVARAAGSAEGVAWTLRVGGLAALAAAWASMGLDEK
jgi:solute carrier family 45, member 1/2/4